MPITSSAKKALRNSKKKRVFNLRRKDKMNDLVKQIKKLVKENNQIEAKKLLGTAYQAIDKSAKANTIKKGAASRKKSRLSKMIKKIAQI